MDDIEVYALGSDEPIIEGDLEMPPIEVSKDSYTEEAASTKAFWATAVDSEDPIEDFYQVKKDLIETGESEFINESERHAIEESDLEARQSIEDFLPDTTIDPVIKQSVLRTYANGGFVSKDLRDRYIDKISADDNSKTLLDQEQQDNVVDNVLNIKTSIKNQEAEEQHREFIEDVGIQLGGTLLATNKIAATVVASIPAGIGGIYSLIKDRDVAKAGDFVEEISGWITDKISAKTDKVETQEAADEIMRVIQKISIPAEWVGDKALDLTGSPAVATTADIVLDPLNLLGLKALSTFKKGSPAHVIGEVNKQDAADLYTSAVLDETGELAKSMGTDTGTILQETVLPDIVETGVLKDNPDIRARIDLQDLKSDYSFNLHRLDPNLSDVAAHQADLDLILNVIKETGSPYYQQANSIVTSPGINIFEGKAVYGRNAENSFVSLEDAKYGLEKLRESIETLPPELQGTLRVEKRKNGYVVEHNWRKEYEPLDNIIFGTDAVNSNFGGIDINNLKYTPIGEWLFPTGIFDRKYESAKERSVDRAAKQANDIKREIRDNITNSKHKKELNSLVNEGEATGKEYFSQAEISAKFPHLSTSQVKDLFDSHLMWRRVAHYEHRILNNMRRNEMLDKGTRSVFDEIDKFVADVHTDIPPAEFNAIKKVFDLEEKSIGDAGKYTKDEFGKVMDENGRQLVRLHEPITDANGNRFNYGLLGGKQKAGALRATVIPRIPGWSPRKHDNHFYIDVIPKNMAIDGIDIKDSNVLRENRRTLAAAQSQFEADEIARNLQAKHPNKEVVVRPDRIDDANAILDDYRVATDLYAQSRKRGEGIQNTRVEDRLKTLMDTATSLARSNTMATWEQATQKSFIKAYGSKGKYNILRQDEFPRSKDDIIHKPNMTKEERQHYNSAVALFNNYSRFKEFSYTSDRVWSSSLHYIADSLESIKLPASVLRDAAKKRNPAVSFPKKLGSFMWINTNVPRQWFIQPQQMSELVNINPLSAPKTFSDLSRMSTMLLGEWVPAGRLGKGAKYLAGKAPGTPAKEIEAYVQAIKDSGIIDSVDTNVLVHGVFHDANKLINTPSDKVALAAKAIPSTINKLGRSLGYDPSEIINKMGIWLQMRANWVKENPGKDWNTPEVKEILAHDTHLYSGNMNRAGNLPYQVGILSPLFQFSAIGHKTFMNLMQNTATSLTTAQRWRLGGMRATTMGLKYGVPGGGLLYAYIDKYGSPETQENAELVKEGLADHLVNNMLNTYFPDEDGVQTDLGVSRSISPFGESGVPYADQIISTLYFVDGNQRTQARYPLFGVANNLNKVHKQWEALWYSNNYDTAEKFQIGLQQALKTSSGFNNWFKAQMIIGTGKKLDKFGNPNGLEYTAAEGYASIIGIHSNKDEWAYDQLRKFNNEEENLRNTANDIYEQLSLLENLENPDGTPVEKLEQMSHALDVAVTEEFFTEDAKQRIMQMILNKASRDTDLKTNIIRKWIDNGHLLSEQKKEKMLMTLERDKSPEIQELVKAIKEGNL